MLDKINEKNRENIDRIVVVQSDIEAIDKSRKKKKERSFVRPGWSDCRHVFSPIVSVRSV